MFFLKLDLSYFNVIAWLLSVIYILCLFLFTCRIRLVKPKLSLANFDKSIEKYGNNYTIQPMHYERILHSGSNEINLVLKMLLLFSKSLVKAC